MNKPKQNQAKVFLCRVLSSYSFLAISLLISLYVFWLGFISNDLLHFKNIVTAWLVIGLVLSFKHTLILSDEDYENYVNANYPEKLKGIFPNTSDITEGNIDKYYTKANSKLKHENLGFTITFISTLFVCIVDYLPTLSSLQNLLQTCN